MPDKQSNSLNDTLRELGNIGCGYALTALSKMTSTQFNIKTPDVEFLEFSKMPSRLGDVEEETVSVLVEVTGELKGLFMLVLKPTSAARLLEAVGVESPKSFYFLKPIQRSALLELGNIMSSSYMTAVAQLTGLESRLSVPCCAVDMLGSLLSHPIILMARLGSKILYIQNVFTIDGKDWAGSTLLLPEPESVEKLKQRLGELI